MSQAKMGCWEHDVVSNPSNGELWRLLPAQLPVLVPRAKLTAGGSSSNPVIVKILWGVVAKEGDAPAGSLLVNIFFPSG